MIYFLCYTRNIAGLILIIGPLVGFLFIDNISVFSMISAAGFACGAIAGRCIAGTFCRLWTGVFCAVGWLGAFLCLTGQVPAAVQAGTALLSICSGAVLVHLPPFITFGWFAKSRVSVLILVWTLCIASGLLSAFFMEKYTYISMAVCAVLMAGGLALVLQTPPSCTSRQSQPVRKAVLAKVFLFMLFTGFSFGVAVCLADIAADFPFRTAALAGFAAGPAISGIMAEKKGIYSSIVLIIFLAETAVSCCSLYGTGRPVLFITGAACLGIGISSLWVAVPVLLYYLFGPVSCFRTAGTAFAALSAGLAASFISGPLYPETSLFMTAALILLILAFFSVFSAWKSRLFLLKDR